MRLLLLRHRDRGRAEHQDREKGARIRMKLAAAACFGVCYSPLVQIGLLRQHCHRYHWHQLFHMSGYCYQIKNQANNIFNGYTLLFVSEMFVRFCAASASWWLMWLMYSVQYTYNYEAKSLKSFDWARRVKFPIFRVVAFASICYPVLWDSGRCREFRAWVCNIPSLPSWPGAWKVVLGAGGDRLCRRGCLARFLIKYNLASR